MRKTTSYIGGLFAMLLAACLTGCVQDEQPYTPSTGGGELTLSMVADDLLPSELKTRAGGTMTRVAKENEEMEIKSLHVFIFGSDGNYIEPLEDHRYQGYTYLTGTQMLRIDKEGFAENTLAERATVCVVANVEDGTFNISTGEEHPAEITNLTDFRNYYYLPKNYQGMLFNLPTEGMPMVGIRENVDLVNSSRTLEIELEALMARIDVNLSINSNASTTELPSIVLRSVTMHNMAQGAPFTAVAEGAESDTVKITRRNSKPETPGGTQYIYNRGEGKSMTFYVFENIRDNNGRTDVYPPDENFKDEYKQRYKPLLAKESATYASFDCAFTSYNGLNYNVTYDLYFGGNSTDDFKVKRNRIYTNDVTIKGLVNVGETPEKIIFDYRVNVEATDNAYFVSALRERQLDAHFNVFPMDVYVMEKGCHVKIEITEPETTNWIRMEKIAAEHMAVGSVPSELNGIAYAAGDAYIAGNGKRNYFTTDLVTNTLAYNTSYDMNHRDRVYFYVDEYLSTSEEPRKAIIRISLIGSDSNVRESYDVEFDQYGLLEVSVRSGNDRYPGDGETIYMERFEEYLNFSDPLEEYGSDFVYTGLPWGADGVTIGRGPNGPPVWSSRCFNNYYHGLVFTRIIVDEANDTPTLNTSPITAAGYCWNKNKRSDSNGNINDPHWFLPGITQMESCLVRYYSDFPEFREHFYWSSAAAKNDDGFLGATEEETSRARATKVKELRENADGTITPVYAESGSEDDTDNYVGENGEGGRALRTTSLRIRACYVGPIY